MAGEGDHSINIKMSVWIQGPLKWEAEVRNTLPILGGSKNVIGQQKRAAFKSKSQSNRFPPRVCLQKELIDLLVNI